MMIDKSKLKELMDKYFKQCSDLNIIGVQSTGALKLPGTVAIIDALLSSLNKAEKGFLWVTLQMMFDRLDENLGLKDRL